MDLDALEGVEVILIVVNAYSGGTFEHVESAIAQLRDAVWADRVHADTQIGCHGQNTAFILCGLHRTKGDHWAIKTIGVACEGRNF